MLQLFYAQNRSMKHRTFESRVQWPTRRSSFKIYLFEWEWILIGLREFIARFCRKILLQNRDMAFKIGCELLLNPR